MCNKRSASSGKAPLMFQICLTPEKSAALQSQQQELLFFSGSFPHACCMQSKDILSTASQTYPENPAGWDKGTPSPAELVQPVLGRHVLTQRTQSSFSFLFPCHPTSTSPSLARAGIQEQIQNSPATGLLLLCLPSHSSTQWQGIKSLRTSAGDCTWVTTEKQKGC